MTDLSRIAELQGLCAELDADAQSHGNDQHAASVMLMSQQEEIERLRAALQWIADTWDSDIEWPGGVNEEASSYASAARYALQGGDVLEVV